MRQKNEVKNLEHNNFQEIQSSTHWLKRNSLLENKTYVCKLLEHFNIDQKKYNFNYNGYGDFDLTLTLKNSYLIQIDEYEKCYKLFAENMASNPKHKPKYRLIEKFYGNDILEDILRYLDQKENLRRGN